MMGGGLLVSGSRGFVGAHVLERARIRGIQAVGATADLLDAEAVRTLVAEVKPQAIIHLAARKPGGRDDIWPVLADNVRMAGNVLSAANEVAPGARVLIPGSAAQYGMGSSRPLPETAKTEPLSPYGAIKCVLEAVCRGTPLWVSVHVIWTRSFNHVGPGQGLDAPVASWSRQIAEAECHDSGTLRTGRLDVVRDFLDVRDVADAYLDLVYGPAEGVFNVCSGRPVSLRHVAETLIGLSAVPIRLTQDPALERSLDPPCVVGDPARLRAVTGWEPQFDLERSLRDVLDEWRGRMRAG
jgi:GDP-4-dehydro-6-deoxy-D-mannose reductase